MKTIHELLEEMGKKGYHLSKGQQWECGPYGCYNSFHADTPEEAIEGALGLSREQFSSSISNIPSMITITPTNNGPLTITWPDMPHANMILPVVDGIRTDVDLSNIPPIITITDGVRTDINVKNIDWII